MGPALYLLACAPLTLWSCLGTSLSHTRAEPTRVAEPTIARILGSGECDSRRSDEPRLKRHTTSASRALSAFQASF